MGTRDFRELGGVGIAASRATEGIMALVVVGSVAIDSIRTPFGEMAEGLGGSGTYFSASSGFLCKPQLVAIVGDDFDLSQLDFLLQRGVDLSTLGVVPGKTFRWKGVYEDDLNEARTLATELNVFQDFAPRLSEAQRDAEVVFLANIQPTLQLSVLDQVRAPRFVAADTMNLWIQTAREPLLEVLRRVDMIVINEGEARMLANERNTIVAAKRIRELGPRVVVIKRGEFGALLYHEERFFFAPAFPLEAVLDPTGAGDTFAGGLMGSIACADCINDQTLRRGVLMGTVLASFAVQGFGLERMRSLTAEELQQRYQTLCAMMSVDTSPLTLASAK